MARTFRLRHLPKLGAKKFVDGRLRKYENDSDNELYGKLAHEWYNFPCIVGTSTLHWYRYSKHWVERKNTEHENCLENGLGTLGRAGGGAWKFFKKMRKCMPREVAVTWAHPWVGYGAGGNKKSYRTRTNRDYRREVRAAEKLALVDDEETVFPVYKKHVLWDMY